MAWQSAHTRLLVEDYRSCFLFYRDVLGMEVGFGDQDSGYADFLTGDASIAVFDRLEMSEAIGAADESAGTGPDRFALILGVDDVDRVTAELEGKGVQLVAQPTDRPDWGIRTAHFRDPDGNLIEINAPTA